MPKHLYKKYGLSHGPRGGALGVKIQEQDQLNPSYHDLSWAEFKFSPDPNQKYLWVVTKDGRLVTGIEDIDFTAVTFNFDEKVSKKVRNKFNPDNVPQKMGHPTLAVEFDDEGGIKGHVKVRIAGELYFDKSQGTWLINDFSGRYSWGHYLYRGKHALRRVAQLFLKYANLTVEVAPIPPTLQRLFKH